MLKQLRLKKQAELLRAKVEELETKLTDLNTREAELETAISEAAAEEDLNLIDEEVEKNATEKADAEEEKSRLNAEIANIEKELEELTVKTEAAKKPEENNEEEKRGDKNMNKRAQALAYLQQEEVRDFYAKVRTAVLNKRALTDADLTIPAATINRIQPMMGDYSSLYNEVDRVALNGTARVIVDGAKPEAIWVEMCDPVTELAAAFEAVELDGYKVGGFIPVCNAILEDSMLDLADYLEKALAQAMAKAVDKSILAGTGAAGKQPEGIIPAIPAGNQVAGETLGEILAHVGLIDTGDDNVEEVIAVMKRTTYYNRILPQTVTNTSDGRQVVQGVNNPNIAGLRVVFSNYAPDDTIILGDFKKYILGERKGITLATSTDVRFIEDQTVFKGIARYDGKPSKPAAFVSVDVTPVPEA